MTATQTTPMTGSRSGQPPGPSRRVRLPWLAAAAGLAVLVAALVLWGFGRAADRREVVMIVAPVEAGDPITDAALGSTMVAIDSSSTQLFSASQRVDLVGKTAAVDLAPGDLLGPSWISTGARVPDGWLEIGGLLRAGRYPVSLGVGDELLAVPREGADVTPVAVLVVESSVGDDRALMVVLAAAPESAAQVAQWAASDDLVLIRVGAQP
jgi:hypothetical protein